MNSTTRELSSVPTGLEFRKPNANVRPDRAVPQMQKTVMGLILFLALAVFWCTSAQATLGDYQTAVTNQASLISYYTFDRTNAVDNFGPNNGSVQGTVQFQTGVGDAAWACRSTLPGASTLGE